ncbi:S9 family peptidase [Amycolatopsis rubida]|uniref:Acyl-peptide hydrolase n=1 Tax=Amycolatopsis rubida TaxID=112413 RepID=A0ABX0C7T9_9PSEU|nr:S9 family peptidase [Amycolatopsis sp. M39]MYW97914.1 prolyl oligopeptidase family serine peptidase [Amycolatopsis rubida]NEC62900.1 S9 family peptidase [Amycolatopsis rubida]OAP23955.1 Prolyl tripeptidyl peptidase precursor [Amycolatopsis sp. M39]
MTPQQRQPRMPVPDYLERGLGPATGRVVDLTDPVASPNGRRIAVSASILDSPDRPPRTAVHVVDVATGNTRELGGTGHPAWSGDSARLAYADGPSTVVVTDSALVPEHSFPIPGIVEFLRFGPRTGDVLVGAAEPGADRSTAQGSGQHGGQRSSWRPHVHNGRKRCGGRRLWRLDLASGTVEPFSGPEWTIWEAGWCGDGFVAVASRDPGESGWYRASIVVSRGPGGEPQAVAESAVQLGLVCAAPAGDAIAFVESVASDRGLIAGDVTILDLGTGQRTVVTGADVSSLCWRDDATLLAAGQRDLTTVVAEIDRTGRWSPLFSAGDRSCGGWYPEAIPIAVEGTPGFAAVIHSYQRPPVLTAFSHSGERRLLDTAHPGTGFEVSVGGELNPVTWRAPDGLEISGLLATPRTPQPHPLVVLIHGGPVAAYRPSWQLVYGWTRLLVANGYAVLHPNPRGSGGRGQEFAGAVFGDIGGADTLDIVSAVDELSARGVIDPGRVALAGRSYGGYLAAWLATQHDRWAAVIAQSPMTDWVSLHFTTNIGCLDDRLLGDVVTNREGRYFSRSPVHFAKAVRAPVLSIAGALDRATSAGQAQELHGALLEQGTDSTLVIYPEEGHHVAAPAAKAHLLTTILEFLGTHLPS